MVYGLPGVRDLVVLRRKVLEPHKHMPIGCIMHTPKTLLLCLIIALVMSCHGHVSPLTQTSTPCTHTRGCTLQEISAPDTHIPEQLHQHMRDKTEASMPVFISFKKYVATSSSPPPPTVRDEVLMPILIMFIKYAETAAVSYLLPQYPMILTNFFRRRTQPEMFLSPSSRRRSASTNIPATPYDLRKRHRPSHVSLGINQHPSVIPVLPNAISNPFKQRRCHRPAAIKRRTTLTRQYYSGRYRPHSITPHRWP